MTREELKAQLLAEAIIIDEYADVQYAQQIHLDESWRVAS